MPVAARNLDWLRRISTPEVPDLGARLHEMMTDIISGVNTVEQQTNSNIQGNPAPPPQPDSLNVVPHPQGVQFSIQHDSKFYQGVSYEIDCSSGGVTHTYDVGSSRNGVLPVGSLTANYQVRTRYPNGLSSTPRVLSGAVQGGAGSSTLLPSQAAGTTRRGQPPGFGGAYRGNTPPVRNK